MNKAQIKAILGRKCSRHGIIYDPHCTECVTIMEMRVLWMQLRGY